MFNRDLMRRLAALLLVSSLSILTVACQQNSSTTTVANDTKVSVDNEQATDKTSVNDNEAEDSTTTSTTNKPSILEALKLTDRDGNALDLSDYKNKLVFVNFWATWCPPCRAEMPDFAKVYNEYKDNDQIKFLFVNELIQGGSIEKTDEFVKELKIDLPLAYDDGTVFSSFGLRSLPTSFILGQDGNPLTIDEVDGQKINIHLGAMSEEKLRSIITTYVKKDK